MKKNIIKFLIFLSILIWVNIYAFKTLPESEKYFPWKNEVFVIKKWEILDKNSLIFWKKSWQLESKWVFISKNLVLSVWHWVWDKKDLYEVYLWKDKKDFIEAELLYKDEKKDYSLLKTKKNYEDFVDIRIWEKQTIKDYLYYFDEYNHFSKQNIFKIDSEKIYINKEFQKWDSWKIFYNENKEIVAILIEYDLTLRLWVLNIIDKSILNF